MIVGLVPFCNRQEAEALSPAGSPTPAILSIHTPGTPAARLSGAWVHILRLQFADASDPDDPTCLRQEQAIAAAEWAKYLHGLSESVSLTVHCGGGVSRSAGAAKAIAEGLGGLEFGRLGKVPNPDYALYNSRVFRLIYNAIIEEIPWVPSIA